MSDTERNTKDHSDTRLIPELFVDIIARVIPGFIILIASAPILNVHETEWHASVRWEALTTSNWGFSLAMLIVVGVVSYTVGLLLTVGGVVVGDWWGPWHWRKAIRKEADLTAKFLGRYRGHIEDHALKDVYAFCKAENKIKVLRASVRTFDSVLLDELKDNDRYAAVILPKMRAEMHLCLHLACGFAVLLCIGVAGHVYTRRLVTKQEGLLAVALGILAVISLVGYHMRNRRLVGRTFSFLRLYMKNRDDGPSPARSAATTGAPIGPGSPPSGGGRVS